MNGQREDIPRRLGASIGRRPSTLLESACRDAVRVEPHRRIGAVLDRVLRWTGADRAFVAEAGSSESRTGPRVLARASRARGDGGSPSRTVLVRAVAGGQAFLSTAPAEDPILRDVQSIRGLRLGFVAAFPLPSATAPETALILDSDRPVAPEFVKRLEHAVLPVTPLLAILLDGPVAWDADDAGPGARLVGSSPAFLRAVAAARAAAATSVPVLLLGETGSGKDEFARLVHGHGRRAGGPFVALNCSALPESLLEAELFGATRGSFTGAERDRPGLFVAAHGGTLFLDEVGEMSPALQAKLLRVLQDGRVRPVGARSETPVDVRIVAATHRELANEVRAGRFRADLYWRLAVAVIRIPALRERPEDLVPLARSLLERLSRRWGLPRGSLEESTVEALLAHRWPGNVRELEAVLARALLRSGGGLVAPHHLRFDSGTRAAPESSPATLEARMIREAVRESRGVLAAAAERIGWSRQKLYRRMRALGITRWESSSGPSASEGSEPGP